MLEDEGVGICVRVGLEGMSGVSWYSGVTALPIAPLSIPRRFSMIFNAPALNENQDRVLVVSNGYALLYPKTLTDCKTFGVEVELTQRTNHPWFDCRSGQVEYSE